MTPAAPNVYTEVNHIRDQANSKYLLARLQPLARLAMFRKYADGLGFAAANKIVHS